MKPRPLSPHLGIYRLPLTAVLSISHRITGVLLVIALLAIMSLMGLAASGSPHFDTLRRLMESNGGSLVLWLFLYAFSVHFCHGVRHLVWDTGRGFDRKRQSLFNAVEVIGGVVIALLVRGIACWLQGGSQ